jgi:hypothetical protein
MAIRVLCLPHRLNEHITAPTVAGKPQSISPVRAKRSRRLKLLIPDTKLTVAGSMYKLCRKLPYLPSTWNGGGRVLGCGGNYGPECPPAPRHTNPCSAPLPRTTHNQTSLVPPTPHGRIHILHLPWQSPTRTHRGNASRPRPRVVAIAAPPPRFVKRDRPIRQP